MGSFFSSVSSGVLVAIVVAVFGLGTVTVRIVSGPAKQASKIGDRLIGAAWIMMILGAVLFGSHQGQFVNLGANDIYAMLGADLMGLSIFFWCAGKLSRLFFR